MQSTVRSITLSHTQELFLIPLSPVRCKILIGLNHLEKFVISERMNQLTHDAIHLTYFDWMNLVTKLRQYKYVSALLQ